MRFVTDLTLYDLTILPVGDPRKLTYYIEPAPSLDESLLFPSVFTPPELSLSFIIATSNNESVLPTVLDSVVRYLQSRSQSAATFSYEIIISDDASSDKTADVVLGYARQSPQIRLLRQPHSLGKGGCIQAGCLHSRGRLILVADADPAIRFEEVDVLERHLTELQAREAMVFGSRSQVGGFGRQDSGVFQKLVSATGVKGVKETQFCLKLFSREAVQWIFPNQHTSLWCWDIELLAIAARRKIVAEIVPIEYGGELEGQELFTRLKEAVDLVQIALFYRIGLWTIRMKANIQPSSSEV